MANFSQNIVGLIPGNTYQITFTTDTTSGILEVTQGTQVIYNSATIDVGGFGSAMDYIHINERIYLDLRHRLYTYNDITISENVKMNGIIYINEIETITITESFS